MPASQAGTDQFQPMTLSDLATALAGEPAELVRRRLVLEFLEGWQWEPREVRFRLVECEPDTCGDERYDVLLAALAEHCASADGVAGPAWCEERTLQMFWFPDDSPAGRADAIVRSPAALRRRGIFIAAGDLVGV